MTEIDSEHFCAGSGEGTLCNPYEGCEGEKCCLYHRKWPTPAQFEQEYGRSADGMPFWAYQHYNDDWGLFPELYTAKDCTYYWAVDGESVDIPDEEIVIACTPYGKPPEGWKPEI
jgi:hypothetical protein